MDGQRLAKGVVVGDGLQAVGIDGDFYLATCS